MDYIDLRNLSFQEISLPLAIGEAQWAHLVVLVLGVD